MRAVLGRRIRLVAALLLLAELVVYVLVAGWIGVGWTILATLATTVLGWALLARQGTRALADLRERARVRQAPGRELGDAGLVAAGGLLMILPGFIGDLVGLLCLLPGTRVLVRRVLTAVVLARVPDGLRGPVRVESVRTTEFGPGGAGGSTRATPLVIEGDVIERPQDRGPDPR
ncbi:FxsA family protein [Blastococcus sp. PRF04-17]|uniref:FxsA family protein n=1 Tax=Blastococcus sp. PRF04-17 TaxID=2933797 RepID=UPI001FF2CC6B|nr:FxsA family protein [Blastococcus sp. PRF04-17]UOY02532.1 FxsA family protein [Blastococcus sp. PRF04-17]